MLELDDRAVGSHHVSAVAADDDLAAFDGCGELPLPVPVGLTVGPPVAICGGKMREVPADDPATLRAYSFVAQRTNGRNAWGC